MMPAGPCQSLPRSERDIMCSGVGDVAPEFKPLLSDDPSKGLSSSDGHAWTLLKYVICINLILLVVSVTILVFGGSIQGQYENQTQLSSAYGLNQYLDKGIQLVTRYGMESENADWSCFCEAIHSRFTSLHLKFSEVAFIRANMHGIANYLVELVNVYKPSTNSLKEFWDFDGSIAINNEGISRQNSATRVSRMSSSVLKKGRERSHSLRKAKIASFLNIVKDLMHEGLLQSHHRVLCLDSDAVNEVRALKKKGFSHLKHVDVSLSSSSSRQRSSHSLVEGFTDKTFDCVFTTVFDHTTDPLLFIAEIERILKVGGLAVMHVSLNAWHDKYNRGMPGDGAKPVTVLFKLSKIVYISAAYAPGLDTVVVFKKEDYLESLGHMDKIVETQENGDDVRVLSEKGADCSGSMVKYACRKCT